MKKVFITGVSGYFGSRLVSYFDHNDDVNEVIGIDLVPPRQSYQKLKFIHHDIRDDLYAVLAGRNIDWAIHAAFILPPIHDKNLMEDINVNGTINFLNACANAGIPQLMHCSSTTAYGFHADNDIPLTEESPLRGNDDFTYAKNKKELEYICRQFKKNNPNIRLTIIRPCFVVGPGFDNPLSRHLTKKIVLMPARTASFQFVHEDDLIELMHQLLLQANDGVYNIASDGVVTFDEMITMLGNWKLKLPFPVMYVLNNLMWLLRFKFITEFPSPALKMVVYPWAASNEKIKKELNYSFKYSTREAFEDFARYIKASK
jgi:UDP-glucose 4-epimerase